MPQATAKDILKQYFGYDAFKEGQARIIDSILSRRDCLGVMPTGAGKSVCFQVPALLFTGITLVISPLISLMKDQVQALGQAGIRAAFINSSLTEGQIWRALDNAQKGLYKIIYIAPERLETAEFIEFSKNTPVAMVAVDEAHCISQWGQDFRPSYRNIADFVDALPERPVVSAFTATATPKVRADIIALLKLRAPTALITGFDRKNLFFNVQKPDDKFAALLRFLRERREKSGIVYCSTRKAVEEVRERLIHSGYNASRYHAGLSDAERHGNQDDFLYDRASIMVATNAFGMGIDKSNVSFVAHYNMPKNMESYYQEAGRAGRDGEPADCVLFYSGQDVRTNMYLIDHNDSASYPDAQTERLLKERDRQRLKEMTFYCHTSDCLRAYILRYFGETAPHFCGNCGNCNAHFKEMNVTDEARKIVSCVYRTGERYGLKTVIDVLRGSKSEKILRWGLDRVTAYNASNLPEKSLRDIANHLVLNGFLRITDDEYPVVKLGARAKELYNESFSVSVKLARDERKIAKIAKSAGKASAAGISHSVNKALFAKLKALRRAIAGEQNIPAFVVFADSTLTDMCIKLPQNEEEFLRVSGVGQVKLERYGRQFLDVIGGFLKNGGADDDAAKALH